MKFALSSCWNSHRHEDGYEMARELADLGFEYVELSHGVRVSLAPGILKAVDEGWLKVSSVHNFCPLPVGVQGAAPNLYEPSAPSARERYMWHAQTLRTLEFANRVGCDAMVVHSGHIRFRLTNPEKRYEEVVESGADAAAVEKARLKLFGRLSRSKGSYMRWLKESFASLVEPCRRLGVRVGIENREGLTELPLDNDMAGFLEELGEPDVFGYWHDSGHAQIKQRDGIIRHAAFLESLRPRLIGFHLHDVSEAGKDHFAPGSGVIDWEMLLAHVQPQDIVVMEMSPRLKAEEILAGRGHLLARLGSLLH